MSLPAKATTPPFNPDSRVPAGVVVESLALDGSALLWQEWHAICWQETHFNSSSIYFTDYYYQERLPAGFGDGPEYCWW